MPTLTSKGYKLPQNGERGSWWQNLLDNWIRMDGHKHDGLDSQLLDARNITKTTQDILAAGWIDVGDGTYEQEVTLPTNITFTKISPTFIVNGGSEDGATVMVSLKKFSATSYKVQVNDNTLSLKVIYA